MSHFAQTPFGLSENAQVSHKHMPSHRLFLVCFAIGHNTCFKTLRRSEAPGFSAGLLAHGISISAVCRCIPVALPWHRCGEATLDYREKGDSSCPVVHENGEIMRENRIDELARTTQSYPLLADLPREHLRKLWEIAEERNYEQDQLIFPEGVKSEFLYLIASGNVALEILAGDQRIELQMLGPGDAMGWSALTANATTHFQARAVSRVQSIAFDGAKLSAAFEYDHSLAYHMMKRLLAMMTDRLDRMRMRIIDIHQKASAAHS
jgi:CRP-like cAMP-binding protein